MIKVLAIKYPSSVDRNRGDLNHLRSLTEVEETNVKQLFGELLFHPNSLFRYNYCLVLFDNRMFVIEPVDFDKHLYVRKEVFYHPLSQLLT